MRAKGLVLVFLIGYCVSDRGASSEAKTDRPVWGWVSIPSIALYEPIYAAPLVNGQYEFAPLWRSVAWLEQTATLETTRHEMIMRGGGDASRFDSAYLDQETGRIALVGDVLAAFKDLDRVRVGDLVVVVDWQRAESYRVTAVTLTTPGDTSWLLPTDAETLVLITCAGDAPAYPYRRVVQAERVSHE